MVQGFSNENQTCRETAYRFAGFELDPNERSLTEGGAPVSLQPKAFDALLLLVSRAQRLVSKHELTNKLWPGIHVSEANLTNTIVTLRKLLGRESIRTVSKYGYRFELPLSSQPGIAPSLYERFSRARSLVEQRSLEKMPAARDLLWLCLAEEPSFAQGWAWLGRCCWFLDKFGEHDALTRELAGAALQRALSIDRDLADAHRFFTLLEVDTGGAGQAVSRLLARLVQHPREPETYVGLVQALRFTGLLSESEEAHRCATELDPAAATSIAHTLFFMGDFASTVEAYTGRSAYYLDAAAWAALGLRDRAVSLLRRRLEELPLSQLMRALVESLLAAIKGERDSAVEFMQCADTAREPEVLVYLARHYAFLDLPEQAAAALEQAAQAGFTCAPETLRQDPWFASLRAYRGFDRLLKDTETRTTLARSTYARAITPLVGSGRLIDLLTRS